MLLQDDDGVWAGDGVNGHPSRQLSEIGGTAVGLGVVFISLCMDGCETVKDNLS